METHAESGNAFVAQPVWQGNRTLTIGNTLKRKRKGYPNEPRYPWGVTPAPAADSSEYVAVLCEALGELKGEWFVWRTYFTNNRHGKLCFGLFGPQAPLSIEKWISAQIIELGLYEKLKP